MAITSIDTASVAAPDRYDFWRSAVCDQFVELDVRPREGADLRGSVTAASVGDTHVRRIAAGAHRFERTAGLARRSDEDYLQLALARRGRTRVVQDGREAVIGPGDFVLYDSRRPFSFDTAGPFAYSVCLHPTRLLPLTTAEMAGATAVRFDGRTGVGAMVPPFLSALHRLDGDQLNDATREAVVATIGDLFVALVRSQVAPAAGPGVHLLRAHAFVEQNLGDPALDPRAVADACSISVSYLQKLFRASGTTAAEHIREQRLQQCWRDLGSAERAGLGIGALAAQRGFPDAAHFSRVFRARFGISPRERRAGGAEVPGRELSS